MKTAYELKDGEIIYTPTGEKVATYDGETLRMARGFAEDHKESVEAWLLSRDEATVIHDEDPTDKSLRRRELSNGVPPKPIGSPEAGDKDPRVVAWIDAHGSPEDKANLKRWREAGLPL